MEPFTPRYLDPTQIAAVFAQILPQLEMGVLESWVRLQSNPADVTLQAAYQRDCETLSRLEAERDRLLPTEES